MSDEIKRSFDLLLSLLTLVTLIPLLILIAMGIKLDSHGPVLFSSQRVGRNNQRFTMYKFRTMTVDTPEIATHLLGNNAGFITRFGRLLRSTSLDELPQLFHVVRGEMSLVGPRPALYSQNDLISLRETHGIHVLLPGITGWAQINGRDNIDLATKIQHEIHYLNHRSTLMDLKILLRTAAKVASREGAF